MGKKESVALSPDLFRGLAAFQEEAQPGPGTGPGEVERAERVDKNSPRQTNAHLISPPLLSAPARTNPQQPAPKTRACTSPKTLYFNF